MTYVTAPDGTRLYADDWGDGPPVVFVHAAYLNSQMWEYQRPALVRAGLRGVAYDRRGHGRSDRPWDGYDYDTLADDLAAVLDHFDLRDVTLVGYSVGGGEVIRYLSRYGAGRVARIALVAATAPVLRRADDNPDGVPTEAVAATIAALRADRPRWFADNAGPFFGGRASLRLTDWAIRLCLESSPQAAEGCVAVAFGGDFRAELRALNLPTLVVHGDADVSAPAALCGRRIAALVSGATYLEYPDAPHGLFATHAERLAADLLAFAETPSRVVPTGR